MGGNTDSNLFFEISYIDSNTAPIRLREIFACVTINSIYCGGHIYGRTAERGGI